MTFIRRMRTRTRHEVEADPPSSSRSWTARDGSRYRVWLAEAPRHLVMHGKTDMVLTFVPMDVPLAKMRDIIRSAPAGTLLHAMTDEQLELKLLEAER